MTSPPHPAHCDFVVGRYGVGWSHLSTQKMKVTTLKVNGGTYCRIENEDGGTMELLASETDKSMADVMRSHIGYCEREIEFHSKRAALLREALKEVSR